jgi:uncharacterized protein involved in exopolysaccharide biosynthesis
LIAVVLLMVLKPIYRADARLMVNPGQGEQGAAKSSTQETAKSEIAILNSNELARDVLSKVTVPAVFPDLSIQSASQSASVPAPDKAIAAFDKQLDVRPLEPSNLVSVSFKSTNPDIAIKVLETLLADLQARHVAPSGADLTGPIEQQISEKQKQIQDLDSQRIAYQNANSGSSVSDQRADLTQQRTQTTSALQDAESKRDTLQKKLDTLKESRANTPKTKTITSEVDPPLPITSDALIRLMALRRKELQLLQQYPATAPAVQQVHAQISVAEKVAQMEEAQAQADTENSQARTVPNPQIASIDRKIQATDSELAPIVSQVDDYKSQIAALDDQIHKLEDSDLQRNTQLDNLQHQIDGMTADLQALRAKLAQARAAGDTGQAKVSSVTVTDAPRLEAKPIFPDRLLFIWIGLGIGAALSLLFILLSLTSRKTILTAEGAERILKMPVVAELPKRAGVNR